MKRYLYLGHRWLGILMCLFFLMWFISGVVMMYVGFPSLTSKERLSGLPNLNANTLSVAPFSLIQEIDSESIHSLRLTTVLMRPAYLLNTKSGKIHGIFADNGEKIQDITPKQALVSGTLFHSNIQANKSLAEPNTKPSIAQEHLYVDQWTVSSGLNHHRPLHKIALNDTEATNLYVSTMTGEVVRDTTQHERFWNWLGANLHWIYPVQLRQHATIWHWVVVILSLLGVLSVLSGGVIGLNRLRLRRRYRGINVTPYRGVYKIHHILGLVCFSFLFTYTLSGMLSMNPFGVFNSDASCKINEIEYTGKFPSHGTELHRDTIRKTIAKHKNLKEIRFYWLDGKFNPVGVSMNGSRLLSNIKQQEMQERVEASLRKAIFECDASSSVIKTDMLNEYDSYYYSHHNSERPLPVYKIMMNDQEKTWFYINARTGEWVFSKTFKQRIQRWLYNGLHSLDFLFLIQNRPLWDVTVITLCLLGFFMSFTFIVIASKRVRINLRKVYNSRRKHSSSMSKIKSTYLRPKARINE